MSAWYSCSLAQQYFPTAYRITCISTSCPALAHQVLQEEEDYKFWPANKSHSLWQSLSNPA